MSDALARAVLDALDGPALDRLADALAPRLAERLAETNKMEDDGYMTAQAAADYLGVSRKRVHDLTSARTLIPDGRDGRTPLYTRRTLDAYAHSHRL